MNNWRSLYNKIIFVIIIIILSSLLFINSATATNATISIDTNVAILTIKENIGIEKIQPINFAISYTFNAINTNNIKCKALDNYDYEGCWELNSKTAKGFTRAFSIFIISMFLIGKIFDRISEKSK